MTEQQQSAIAAFGSRRRPLPVMNVKHHHHVKKMAYKDTMF
jgi:hypothetical protein